MRHARQPSAEQIVDLEMPHFPADLAQPLGIGARNESVIQGLERNALLAQLALGVFVAVQA
jgi:hypothetical protein